MVFNVLRVFGMSQANTSELVDYFSKLEKQVCNPKNKKQSSLDAVSLVETASNMVSIVGFIPERGSIYLEEFVFPLLKDISEYMPTAYNKSLIVQMLHTVTEAQRLMLIGLLRDENDMPAGRRTDIVEASLKRPKEVFEALKDRAEIHRKSYEVYTGSRKCNSLEERLAESAETIENTKRYIRKYNKSDNVVLSSFVGIEKQELATIELLREHARKPQIQALLPVIKELSQGEQAPYASVSWLAAKCENPNVNRINRTVKYVEKIRKRALRGRGSKEPILDKTLDYYTWACIAAALRNKRWLRSNLDYLSHIHTVELGLGLASLSNGFFVDDYISPEFDESKVVRLNPHKALEPIGYNWGHTSTIIDAIKESGLHVSDKLSIEITNFLSGYCLKLVESPEVYAEIAARTRRAYREKGSQLINICNVEENSVSQYRFPSGRKVLDKANDLIANIIDEHLVEKPGKKFQEWRTVKTDPVKLARFIRWDILPTVSNGFKERTNMYYNLLLNQPSFAMVNYTNLNQEVMCIKNVEKEWRDVFAGWASGSCIDPVRGADMLTYKQLDQKQIWWAGKQWGLAYVVHGQNCDNKGAVLDSIEVHPAFFKKFKDKFKISDKEVDDKLLNSVLNVVMQENEEKKFYIKPTSNQDRISNWLKNYARSNGHPIYNTSVRDRFMDVKYSQLKDLYLIGR